ESRPGTFRYPMSIERRSKLVDRAHLDAGVTPEAVQYLEYCGSSEAAETEVALQALENAYGRAPPSSIAVGSISERVGHTLANIGVASLTKLALGLHRRELPPQWKPDTHLRERLLGTPLYVLDRATPWPAGHSGRARCAALSG